MDSIEKLTTAISIIEEARGVPLSASCVLHRGEILEVLDGARAALPNDLEAARKILASRDSLIEEGRLSAEALIASAREEVSRMIEQTAIVSAAREEAQHILDDAHLEADQEREEVEKYIDSRLATLEVILNKNIRCHRPWSRKTSWRWR
jgi:vacuolar-type H+-ATPase subunit H